MIDLIESLSFDDITLVPAYSEISTRADVDTSIDFLGINLKAPIISANMDTVTSSELAIALGRAGGIGCLHRFSSVYENVNEFLRVKNEGLDVLVSIGVNPADVERAQRLVAEGAKHIVIDIAHGDSKLMIDTIKRTREMFGKSIKIIAGNIVTYEAATRLLTAGADALKVGVGPGSACSTRVVTGHGIPMVTAIHDVKRAIADFCNKRSIQLCSDATYPIKLIADGGIRASGDIVKALAMGADVVMIGSLFASTVEAPGERINEHEKIFRGMASKDVYDTYFPGKSTNIAAEGVATTVKITGTVESLMSGLVGGLKSGCTYSGVKNPVQLRWKARFMKQSISGLAEGRPHILGR